VRLVAFGPAAARAPRQDLLENVTLAPLTPPLAAGVPVQAACFRLAPGGRIARHPAAVPQILAVVAGSGWVSGSDGREEEIDAGRAAFWEAGESHETRSDEGMTAIVIEGEGLRPCQPAE
jgi:quercetin dioxygenase-like cupin family protein